MLPLPCLLTFSLEDGRMHSERRSAPWCFYWIQVTPRVNGGDACAQPRSRLSHSAVAFKMHCSAWNSKSLASLTRLKLFLSLPEKKRLWVLYWAKQYKNGYFILRILLCLIMIYYLLRNVKLTLLQTFPFLAPKKKKHKVSNIPSENTQKCKAFPFPGDTVWYCFMNPMRSLSSASSSFLVFF